MISEKKFSSVFDYGSAFEYGPADINMKPTFNRNNYKSVFSYAVSMDFEDESETSRETWASSIFRSFVTASLYFVTLISLPLSYWTCVKRVHALERIVLMRLGKLQPIKGPGYALVLPCVDKWARVDLRPRHFSVCTPQLLTADGGIVEAKTDVEFRVTDVTNYVLKLNHQEDTIRDLSLFCLSNIISEKDQEDLDRQRDIITSRLKDELNANAVKWGLEVSRVSFQSVNVLKAAEPVNAIGTLVSALKAATGSSSDGAATFFPLLPTNNVGASNTKLKSNTIEDTSSTNIKLGKDYISAMKSIANSALQEGLLIDLKATFRFDIVGTSTKMVYFIFDKNEVSVIENNDSSLHSDVQVTLTEDNLWSFLQGQISPLEAYMDGKVMVTGNWSLLRSLSKVFDVCKQPLAL